MKPTKLTNFKFTFHGPMTRQLFELGDVAPQETPGYLSIGIGKTRAVAITRAIGGFRDTPAAAAIGTITDRVQMNMQSEWQQPEGSDEDGTLMFCIIEVEVE
jgi:hypothetical protein